MPTRALILLAAIVAAPQTIVAGDYGGGHHGPGGVCCPIVKLEKVEDYCWEVRSKEICIPPVRFPWQKSVGDHGKKVGCCPAPSPHGGKTRCVKYLRQQPREKETCVYQWNVVAPGKGRHAGDAVEPLPIDGEIPDPPATNSARRPESLWMRILQR